MAAVRRCRPLLCSRRLAHTEPSVEPSPPPASLYPPVVASLTAKSQAAKLRRREHFYQGIHDAPSVEEKLRLYGKRQRLKYVVYPQTWALSADRWYQHFTKTAFVQGLPAEAEGGGGELDLAPLRSLLCDVLLQEHFYQRKRRPFLFRGSSQGPAPFLTHLVPALTSHLASLNPVFASYSALGAIPFLIVQKKSV